MEANRPPRPLRLLQGNLQKDPRLHAVPRRDRGGTNAEVLNPRPLVKPAVLLGKVKSNRSHKHGRLWSQDLLAVEKVPRLEFQIIFGGKLLARMF